MKFAKAFANRGKNLIIIARSKDNLNKLKEEILQTSPSLKILVKSVDLSKIGRAHV